MRGYLRGDFGRNHESLLIEFAKGDLIRSGAKAEVDRIEKLLARNRVLRRHKAIVLAYENEQKKRGKRYSKEYDQFQVRHESFFELLDMYGVR